MEWKIGEKYFFKLIDKSCLTGVILSLDESLGFLMINIIDKYGKDVGFRADNIEKYELLTKKDVNNEVKQTSQQEFTTI